MALFTTQYRYSYSTRFVKKVVQVHSYLLQLDFIDFCFVFRLGLEVFFVSRYF